MEVYDAPDYRAFVRERLAVPARSGGDARPTRKALAEHLRCHSTFISHVVARKADFSNEQAVRCAAFFGLDADAADYFVDLVSRDRAGDAATRALFDRRLTSRREAWLELAHRLRSEERLSGEAEHRYFGSWLLQLVHLCCMLPKRNTAPAISRVLGLSESRVRRALEELAQCGLVERKGDAFTPGAKRLHLDRASPTFQAYHASWRLKIASDAAAESPPTGVHYTSAMTISRTAAARLHQLVVEHIEAARAIASHAVPEELCVLAVDFYALTASTPDP